MQINTVIVVSVFMLVSLGVSSAVGLVVLRGSKERTWGVLAGFGAYAFALVVFFWLTPYGRTALSSFAPNESAEVGGVAAGDDNGRGSSVNTPTSTVSVPVNEREDVWDLMEPGKLSQSEQPSEDYQGGDESGEEVLDSIEETPNPAPLPSRPAKRSKGGYYRKRETTVRWYAEEIVPRNTEHEESIFSYDQSANNASLFEPDDSVDQRMEKLQTKLFELDPNSTNVDQFSDRLY